MRAPRRERLGREGARRVRLPVLDARVAARTGRPLARSRLARWRAAVLVLVHVAIAGHVLHWALTGRSVSRFVLSDTMRTLEQGEINPGFLLLGAGLLVTAVAGRFLCGWACHMGALQDLCRWVMRRCGVRPRPFRARLLGWVPLGLALYMFVWPTVKREAVAPALRAWWPEALAYVGALPPRPSFTVALTTDRLWEGLPGPIVGVVFLLVCGVASVYFLGARGLCRYGCPYGGLFAPAERLAPARIVVDLDACDRCGVCTAVCTSNVRVHEEVNAYGRVVSHECVRTLDCVSACPQGALSFGLARPSLARGRPREDPPRPRYDLTWPEELGVLAMFGLTFATARGLYGLVPMLMAVGVALCVSFIAWRLWRLGREPNARFGGVQLRRAGRLCPGGVAFATGGAVVLALLAHSTVVRGLQWRAAAIDAQITAPADVVLAGHADRIPPEQAALAARAVRLYRAASPWWRGGWGLASTPAADVRAAGLALVAGEPAEAEEFLRAAIARGPASDTLHAHLARVLLLRGQREAAVAHLDSVNSDYPSFARCLELLCELRLVAGQRAEALAACERSARAAPGDWTIHRTLAATLLVCGRVEEAVRTLRDFARREPRWASACAELIAQVEAARAGAERRWP